MRKEHRPDRGVGRGAERVLPVRPEDAPTAASSLAVGGVGRGVLQSQNGPCGRVASLHGRHRHRLHEVHVFVEVTPGIGRLGRNSSEGVVPREFVTFRFASGDKHFGYNVIIPAGIAGMIGQLHSIAFETGAAPLLLPLAAQKTLGFVWYLAESSRTIKAFDVQATLYTLDIGHLAVRVDDFSSTGGAAAVTLGARRLLRGRGTARGLRGRLVGSLSIRLRGGFGGGVQQQR